MKPSNHRMLFRTAAAVLLGVAFPASAFAPPGRYTIPGDGTVHDNQTGLVWQQTLGDGGGMSWSAAATYCTNLSLAGHTNWRVPSMKELQTLVDETVSDPSIDTTAFPGTPSSWFWTSSPLAGYSSYAWYVLFYYGITNYNDVGGTGHVRCVR